MPIIQALCGTTIICQKFLDYKRRAKYASEYHVSMCMEETLCDCVGVCVCMLRTARQFIMVIWLLVSAVCMTTSTVPSDLYTYMYIVVVCILLIVIKLFVTIITVT